MDKTKRQQQIGAVHIPSSIMCQKNLTLTQKVIWGRIKGLAVNEGYCYASNKWIGEQIGFSKGTISNNISVLVDKGYVKRQIIRDKARKIEERRLFPIEVPTQELIPINAGIDTPINAKVEGSIRDSSDTIKKKHSPSSSVKNIFNHLNELREQAWEWKKFTPLKPTKPNCKHISARLAEGKSEAELILILDYLAQRDTGDERSRRYFDNVTPFRVSNCDRYLTMARNWEADGRPLSEEAQRKADADYAEQILAGG